jgi:hypothetical protein
MRIAPPLNIVVRVFIVSSAVGLSAPIWAEKPIVQEELPIAFDNYEINISRPGSKKAGDDYVGTENAVGVVNPCHVTIKFTGSSGIQYLHLQAILPGGLAPGEYQMANNVETLGDMKYSYMPERYFPGLLLGGFRSGTASNHKTYRIKSGSMSIDSVIGGQITGRVNAYGVTSRREDIGGEWQYVETGQAPISVPFSVSGTAVVGRLGDEPYPCLHESNMGEGGGQSGSSGGAESGSAGSGQPGGAGPAPLSGQAGASTEPVDLAADMLYGTWLLTHTRSNGKDRPANTPTEFRKDGSMIFYDQSGNELSRGEFSVQGDILMFEDGRVSQTWKVISLENDLMQMDRKGTGMFFKRQ